MSFGEKEPAASVPARTGRVTALWWRFAIACLTAGLLACSDAGVEVAGPTGANPTPVTGPTTQDPGQAPADNPTTNPPDSAPEPPITVGSGVVPLDQAHRDAARFLAQTTFGPGYDEIAALAASGDYNGWLERQFNLPASTTLAYVRANSNGSGRNAIHDIWWNHALGGEDQLRQRVAFALSQIFVVSDLDFLLGNNQYGMASYYDMLISNAFGNYRDLLKGVTLHPVMGVYLSMVRNEKANRELNIRPDENYAREVLQLFSIGLHKLNIRGEAIPLGVPEPAYTQQQVEEFARVFTGWDYPNSNGWTDNNFGQEFFLSPMVPVEDFHDKGSKQLLSGTVLPAGQSAAQDLEDALDNIFFHPNVGPFISKLLIQRLVTSNPRPGYIERVATVFNDNGLGERGDLQAVVRAIVLDEEARNGHRSDANFGKIREPLIKLAHFFRALDGTPGPQAGGKHSSASFPMERLDEMMNQAVMRSKSVFNFYQPDHPVSAGSDLLAPEMQILTESALSLTHNNYHHQIYRFTTRDDLSDDNPRVTLINLEPLVSIAANGANLVDWLNLVFFSGEMPASTATILLDHINTISGGSDAGRFARVEDALFLMTAAPASNLQR